MMVIDNPLLEAVQYANANLEEFIVMRQKVEHGGLPIRYGLIS